MLKQFTAGVYIVARINDEAKVFLHKHKKWNFWLEVGGHVESHENPVETALREAKEEAGIDVTLYNPKRTLISRANVVEIIPPAAILEELLPARGKDPEHVHIDCIYFGITHEPEKVRMQEEFGWFSLLELAKLDLKVEVRENAGEAIKKCASMLMAK